MQTPTSRPGSLDVLQKPSPTTPKIARKLKTPGSNQDSVPSPNSATKTPKDNSPKIVDRKSPRRNLAAENKRPNKVAEMEARIAHLQEELKAAKNQLSSTESSKRRAQHEAQEAKKQLVATSAELESTQKQLSELCESEESRVHELRKISHDRDKAWQSELDAVQKQHSMDSAALASAMNEIQKLKTHLEKVSHSEASQARHAESAHAEIRSLRNELTETLLLVEKLKEQLNDSREYEDRALEEVNRARMQLEVVRNTEATLKMENANTVESYNSLLVELEESKNRMDSLEELSGSFQIENDLKDEVSQLRGALDAAERRYEDEYVQSTVQIRNAYEVVERARSESCKRESELETKLKESMAEVEELRNKLIEKENALESFSCENWGLSLKLEQNQTNEIELEEMKASLLDKEAKMKIVKEENEMLKNEILEREKERSRAKNEAVAFREAEREALKKVESLTEEADKSVRKAARVTEQLDATQASNSEMEAELRRLKVQHDQWRKAAEAAAAMLSNGGGGNYNNGKYLDRAGSLDYHSIDRKLSSQCCEDSDEDLSSPKKKNGNVLRKIGVLLKKGQK
ncbi:hypothetical protein ABFX02_10G040700 [Erythranthe guttata]